MEPKDLVATGYDRMADRHLAWIDEIQGDPRRDYLNLLLDRLAPKSLVVDLGCGAGVPSTALLAQRHRVLGIDVSSAQLRLARERVPTALLVRADFAAVALRPARLDAVTASYSMGHVPRRLHAGVLTEVFQALRPGGWFLTTMSVDGTEDTIQQNFLGVPMFFSGFDAQTNRALLQDAGFRIDTADEVAMREPEGEARFLWVLAERPAPR